jgi:hypothetical protein
MGGEDHLVKGFPFGTLDAHLCPCWRAAHTGHRGPVRISTRAHADRAPACAHIQPTRPAPCTTDAGRCSPTARGCGKSAPWRGGEVHDLAFRRGPDRAGKRLDIAFAEPFRPRPSRSISVRWSWPDRLPVARVLVEMQDVADHPQETRDRRCCGGWQRSGPASSGYIRTAPHRRRRQSSCCFWCRHVQRVEHRVRLG